eukprot:9415635-Pyramimonas_sp.AAC.1
MSGVHRLGVGWSERPVSPATGGGGASAGGVAAVGTAPFLPVYGGHVPAASRHQDVPRPPRPRV